jgi:hypothetical protein
VVVVVAEAMVATAPWPATVLVRLLLLLRRLLPPRSRRLAYMLVQFEVVVTRPLRER